MSHYLSQPCSNCPFLVEGGVRLMASRVRDICNNALTGGVFPCHKTTGVDGRTLPPKKRDAQCAGAVLFAEKQGKSSQMTRVAERLGLLDVSKIKGIERVFGSTSEMLVTALDADEQEAVEPCSVVNANCEAPAGWDDGREGDASAEYTCSGCGEPVCGECSTVTGRSKRRGELRLCDYCNEEERE